MAVIELPPGRTAIDGGQEYEVLGLQDHNTGDDRLTFLIRFRSKCAACREPFTFNKAMISGPAPRRCEPCRSGPRCPKREAQIAERDADVMAERNAVRDAAYRKRKADERAADLALS